MILQFDQYKRPYNCVNLDLNLFDFSKWRWTYGRCGTESAHDIRTVGALVKSRICANYFWVFGAILRNNRNGIVALGPSHICSTIRKYVHNLGKKSKDPDRTIQQIYSLSNSIVYDYACQWMCIYLYINSLVATYLRVFLDW